MKLKAAGVRSFLYWVNERETVRLKRVAGQPAPWTRDPIISKYRFCNVRREHDRVSQWIVQRVLRPYADHPNLWIMVALSRYINWPDTINALMEMGLWPTQKTPRWEAIGSYLDQRVVAGEQTWTGAYMIRAESNPDAEWYSWGKGRYVAEVVVKGLWDDRARVYPLLTDTVEGAWNAIQGHYGFGSFMAGQVVADYTYTNMLNSASDLYIWAPLGPGSRRGLNRLTGRDLTQTIDQAVAVGLMRELRHAILDKLGDEYASMTLHDVQNCLCEVDKFLRVKNGEGRPRSIYRSQA